LAVWRGWLLKSSKNGTQKRGHGLHNQSIDVPSNLLPAG